MEHLWIVVTLLSMFWVIWLGYSLKTLNRPDPAVRHTRLWCDDLKQEAEVEFVSREGVPVAIRRCSLMAGEVFICRQRCLVAAAARGA